MALSTSFPLRRLKLWCPFASPASLGSSMQAACFVAQQPWQRRRWGCTWEAGMESSSSTTGNNIAAIIAGAMQKFSGVGGMKLRVWRLRLSKESRRLWMEREQREWKVLEVTPPAARSLQVKEKEWLGCRPSDQSSSRRRVWCLKRGEKNASWRRHVWRMWKVGITGRLWLPLTKKLRSVARRWESLNHRCLSVWTWSMGSQTRRSFTVGYWMSRGRWGWGARFKERWLKRNCTSRNHSHEDWWTRVESWSMRYRMNLEPELTSFLLLALKRMWCWRVLSCSLRMQRECWWSFSRLSSR